MSLDFQVVFLVKSNFCFAAPANRVLVNSVKVRLHSEILHQDFLFQMLDQSLNHLCESQRSRHAGNTFQKCHDAKGKRDHTSSSVITWSHCKIKQVQNISIRLDMISHEGCTQCNDVTPQAVYSPPTCMRGPDPAPFTVRVMPASRLCARISNTAHKETGVMTQHVDIH